MARLTKYTRITLEPNLTKIIGRNPANEETYESYIVSYSNKYIECRKTFTTYEDAVEFNNYCKQQINKLSFEFLRNKQYNYPEYPENLLTAIGIVSEEHPDYYVRILPEFNRVFKEVSEKILTPREICVVEYRYKDMKTLEEIGKIIDVTRERIRQIEQKAINKLTHYKSAFLFEEEKKEEFKQEIKDQLTYEAALEIVKEHLQVTSEKEVVDILTKPSNEPIESLDLIPRSYHCLRRAGIQTIADLLNRTEEDLHKIRNMGRKSVKEIKAKLDELNLSLKENNYELDYLYD